jgi:hypothetical protein
MKKASPNEMRPQYKRSDFGKLVRGKYAARASAGTNVVILEPAVAKAFPTDKAVNDALRVVLEVAAATARLTQRSTRTPRRRRTAPAGGTD